MARRPAHAARQCGWLRHGTTWLGAVVTAVAMGAPSAQAQEETPEPAGVSGYLRVDTDKYGTQIWFCAQHLLKGLSIVSDVYLVNTIAELDVGPVLTVGKYLALSPMGGLVFDLGTTDLTTVVPQLYVYLRAGNWYLESWENVFFELKDEWRPHYFADRTFLLYTLSDVVAFGPHAELSLNLEDRETSPEEAVGASADKLTSLAVGGALSLGYGEDNTLLLFFGYETQEEARGGHDGIAGRVTFVREW